MFVIPSKETKKFSQPNYGDTQGNLWGTFNVDLTKNTGRVRTTRTEIITDSSDDSDIKLPTAFELFDIVSASDQVFVAYAGKIFIGGTDTLVPFVQDTLTNSPIDTSNQGDIKLFNKKLYATQSTKLKRLNSGDTAWVDIATLTSGVHQLCQYSRRLYFVDLDNVVKSIDTAETVVTSGDYTLDLSSYGGHISWIIPGSNRIWIGLTKNNGTRGLIFEWDGVSENAPNKWYEIEAQGSAGCTLINDVPYVIDIEGRLLAFNGGSFQEVARLPIIQYDALNQAYASTQSTKICHFNGIKYINDAILINIDSANTGSFSFENFPSGIYEYTKENGLTHKFSHTNTKFGETTKDYGQIRSYGAGAIFDSTARSTNTISYYSSVIFGSSVSDGTVGGSINTISTDMIIETNNDEPHFRQGHIVTPFLESTKIKDVWNKIFIKYRKFLDNSATIMVKYRTRKDVPIIIQNITWSSQTTLTGSGSGFSDITAGMEIEVLNGNGAGDVAHVLSSVDDGVGNFTITLDKPIVGVSASDISDVRFQTWNKLPVITADNNQYKELSIPQYNKDTELQVKVVMNWDKLQNELREVIIINETEQYAK